MSPEIQTSNQDQKPEIPAFRIVPHIEGTRSLHFDIIEREVPDGVVIKIGRFTDKSQVPNRITFKSKVVSRGHAEIWHSEGKFYIKDTKSSSGTFINHVRLSSPNTESKPHLLKDGDIIQLGVDYQGGTEEIYRCVKMRVELNNSWQRPIKFSLNALKQFKQITQLGNSEAMKQITDCCICLSGIGPCQALFLAPCSHVFHYKCIRPILFSHHSGFLCPLCRSFADLEAPIDNSIDWEQLLAEQEEAEKQEANNAQKKDEESLNNNIISSNNNNNNDSEDNDNNREWGDNLADEELMDEESSNSNENYDNDNNQTVDLSTTPVNNNNMITTITPTITTASSSSSSSNASAIGATAQKGTISSNNSSTNANSNPPSTAS